MEFAQFWSSDVNKGYFFMVLLALQYALQPFVQKRFVSSECFSETLVVACDLFKIVIASILVVWETQGRVGSVLRNWSLRSCLTWAAIPALIYSLQNNLVQISYQNLDGLTFNLINQSKLLFAAVFGYLILSQRQSKQQMVALFLLTCAAVLLVTGGSTTSAQPGKAVSPTVYFYLGMIPLCVASVSSGLAGALCQQAVQVGKRNTNLFSLEMAVFSVVSVTSCLIWAQFAYGEPMGVRDVLLIILGERSAPVVTGSVPLWNVSALLRGWTPGTLIPVFTNAIGGVLVGQVTKYAGSVKKGFAITSGLLLSGVINGGLTYLQTGKMLGGDLLLAFLIVTFSTWLHSTYPYKPHKA